MMIALCQDGSEAQTNGSLPRLSCKAVQFDHLISFVSLSLSATKPPKIKDMHYIRN